MSWSNAGATSKRRFWCKWRGRIGYAAMLNWLRASMGELKAEAVLFEGRPFDREVIILVRSLVSSVQAQSARLCGDDGRARPVDGAYDDHVLGAALRRGVRETLAPICPGGRPVMAGRRDLRQDPRRVVLPVSCC